VKVKELIGELIKWDPEQEIGVATTDQLWLHSRLVEVREVNYKWGPKMIQTKLCIVVKK